MVASIHQSVNYMDVTSRNIKKPSNIFCINNFMFRQSKRNRTRRDWSWVKGLLINSNYLSLIRERARCIIEFEWVAWNLKVNCNVGPCRFRESGRGQARAGEVLASAEWWASDRNLCLGCGWRAARRRRHTR